MVSPSYDVDPRDAHVNPGLVVARGHLEEVVEGLLDVLGPRQVPPQGLQDLSLGTEAWGRGQGKGWGVLCTDKLLDLLFTLF